MKPHVSMKARLRGIRAPLLACIVSTCMANGIASAAGFAGTWYPKAFPDKLKTADGKDPPLLPAAAQTYRKHQAERAKGNVAFDLVEAKCSSATLPRIMYMPYPFILSVGERNVTFAYQFNHSFRILPIADHPREAPYDMALGVGAAKVDGTTLTIESVAFTDATVLDRAGMPHTDQLKLTEKYRLTNGGKEMVATVRIEDPGTFSRAWEAQQTFERLPADTILEEDVCLDRLRDGLAPVQYPSGGNER